MNISSIIHVRASLAFTSHPQQAEEVGVTVDPQCRLTVHARRRSQCSKLRAIAFRGKPEYEHEREFCIGKIQITVTHFLIEICVQAAAKLQPSIISR